MLAAYFKQTVGRKRISVCFTVPHRIQKLHSRTISQPIQNTAALTNASSNSINTFAIRSHTTLHNNRNMSTTSGPIEQQIITILADQYKPTHLEVINESYMHSVPKNSETHFKVIIVSNTFDGMSIIQRHRAINTALADLLQPGKVHALSITAKTEAQWNKNNEVAPSPNCLGGSKHDKKSVTT